MEKVNLVDKNVLFDLKKILNQELPARFTKGEKIAVKAHLGEYENLFYLRPPLLETVVYALKEIGSEPFIFDTTTWYHGSRHTPKDYEETARKNGFTKESMGCPIIFSDESVKRKGLRYYKEVGIAKDLAESDGMVVVSHVKGHEDASFGGAIKNLGMGGVDVKAKMEGHILSRPELVGECVGCGTCAEICPYGSITVEGNSVKINEEGCFGCNACVRVCPQNALAPKVASVRQFIAEAAAVVLSTFKEDKVYYVNVLMDIVKHCDCLKTRSDDFGQTLCPDIGVLASEDIASIDRASLDLINKATGIENFFLDINKTDPYEQVETFESFRGGKKDYSLVEI
ncbi:MAG: DUF362 domain-containing protein [Candidatus Altiarchaeota archaeon]